MMDGGIGQGRGEIDRPILLAGKPQAQVPLTDTGRIVSLAVEQGCQGHSPGLQQGRILPHQYPAFEAGAPVIPPGQNAVAGGCTDRRGRMGIGKGYSFPGHPVKIGRGKGSLLVEAGDVSIAHVISQDVKDIRLVLHHLSSFTGVRLPPVPAGGRNSRPDRPGILRRRLLRCGARQRGR